MAAIAATSYATPSAQVWQSRARVDQARRDADQAEANARQLREQADQAEQASQQSQTRLRDATAAATQSDSTYSTQLRKQIATKDSRQSQALLHAAAVPNSNGPAFSFPDNRPRLDSTPWAKVTQRISSGSLLNQTA